MQQSNSPSLISLFTTVGVFLVVAVYGFISLNTEDFLWWKSTFDERPKQFVVYCYGNTIEVTADNAHFNSLTSMLNEILSGRKNWDSLTMSPDTYTYYQESDAVMVLEAQYEYPVRIHSIYRYFSRLQAIILPLDGRHSQSNAVFGHTARDISAGALHTNGNSVIRDYLDTSGLCNLK